MNDTVYLTFHDNINVDSAKRFVDFSTKVIQQYQPQTLYFLFSSGGGAVDSGVTMYNFLLSLPQKVIMHNIGAVDSIANAVFLAGVERYAAPTSAFLLHGITWNFPQPRTLTYTQMRETLSRFDAAEQLTAQIIADRCSLTPDEVRQLFRQGESKNPAFALEKGIISDVRSISVPSAAPHHAIV